MELSAEKIGSNWNYFISLIKVTISGERKNKLIEFYQERANRIALAPYSSRTSDVNCFAGGYIEHVLRVFECVEVLHRAWTSVAKSATYTKEELFFVALNHELGLIGTSEDDYFVKNSSQWHVKNRGEVYTFNSDIPYSLIADRTLFLLQENGIKISFNEMLGIKLHDGLYEKANEKYLTGYLAETKPRTSLVYIIHHASVMAKQIEFERDSTHLFKNVETKQEEPKNKELDTVGQITPQVINEIQVPISASIANLLENYF
jgi:hypothetical protein